MVARIFPFDSDINEEISAGLGFDVEWRVTNQDLIPIGTGRSSLLKITLIIRSTFSLKSHRRGRPIAKTDLNGSCDHNNICRFHIVADIFGSKIDVIATG
jgi:hypothetical protein